MTIRVVEPPRDYDDPADDAAGYEGRLRLKLESGVRLDLREALYLAHLPSHRDDPYPVRGPHPSEQPDP